MSLTSLILNNRKKVFGISSGLVIYLMYGFTVGFDKLENFSGLLGLLKFAIL